MREDKRIFLLRKYYMSDLKRRFENIGVHPGGIKIMEPKFSFLVFYITNLTPLECNILKQEALSCGAEAAVPMRAVECKFRRGDIFLSGTIKELEQLSQKLKIEPFFLKRIGQEIEETIQEKKRPYFKISSKKRLSSDKRPIIMGILNITPDSFSDGGRFFNFQDAVKHGMSLCEDGADIIDIGGESTRPGSLGISTKEEIKRVIPVIKYLAKEINIPISIDTTKSEVAEAALDNGAKIINDISGLRFDRKMAKIAARYDCGLIIMHTRSRPRTMQKGIIHYKNLLADITDYLARSIEIACDAGANFENIAIDPGIGFGKTVEQNIQIIKDILAFRTLKRPVLIGASRKSFLGHITGRDVNAREDATTAIHTIIASYGADILRVHNVKATMDAIRVSRALM